MNNNSRHLTLSLKLTFLIFSMVLNCMGIIILQLSTNEVEYNKLGFLEAFKDLPIAFISLFAVNFINKIGSKSAIITSLTVVAVCTFIMPLVEVFWFYKLWFAIIGVCFSVAKICVYSIIRNNYSEESNLSKTMNTVEASFMIGIFLVNVVFGWLISSEYSAYWKFGFMLISFVCIVTIALLSNQKIKDTALDSKTSIVSDFYSFKQMPILLFFGIVFFIVFIEQTFNSWLPSFYKKHLNVDSFFAIQATSMLALCSYLGRVIASKISGRFSLSTYFTSCILICIGILILIFSLQSVFGKDFITLTYLFPLIGLFLAPLYPVVNASMISHIPAEKINTFTSLIIIFSSFGSSISSIAMASLFQNQLLHYYSIYIILILILLLIISLLFFKLYRREIKK